MLSTENWVFGSDVFCQNSGQILSEEFSSGHISFVKIIKIIINCNYLYYSIATVKLNNILIIIII